MERYPSTTRGSPSHLAEAGVDLGSTDLGQSESHPRARVIVGSVAIAGAVLFAIGRYRAHHHF